MWQLRSTQVFAARLSQGVQDGLITTSFSEVRVRVSGLITHGGADQQADFTRMIDEARQMQDG